MDPKHQFAAQYVLSRAANERREREALLAAHLAMTTNMQPSLLSGHMTSAAAAHHMAAVAVSTAAAASSVANIGGTAFVTGTPPNLVAFKILDDLVTFPSWMGFACKSPNLKFNFTCIT